MKYWITRMMVDNDEYGSNVESRENFVSILNNYPASDVHQIVEDPLTAVEELLAELILSCDVVEIDQNIATRLIKCSNVQEILHKTQILNYVNIHMLHSCQRTMCFLINLTNLLWIHTSLLKRSEKSSSLFCNNWSVRQVENSLIGYNIGQLHFVSLYDLYSILLHFPHSIYSNKLGSLSVMNDPRIIFALSLPDVCTPRVKVLSVDNLEYELETLHKEYLQTYITVSIDMNLLIPFPVLWYLEQVIYFDKPDDKTSYGDESVDTIQEKLNLLAEFLRECGLPYFEIIHRDIYFLNEAKFTIKFTYTEYEKEEMHSCNRILWKSCVVHKSLFYCLQQHLMIITSMFGREHKHSSKYCLCDVNSSNQQLCTNYLLLCLSDFFNCMVSATTNSSYDFNVGLGCLNSVASFITTSLDQEMNSIMMSDITAEDYKILMHLIGSYFPSVSINALCDKINICRRISAEVLDNHKFDRWISWLDVFNADPNDVLCSIIDFGDVELARDWFFAVLAFDSSFVFTVEVISNCINFICKNQRTKILEEIITELRSDQIVSLLDFLIKRHYPASNIVLLITILLEKMTLTTSEKLKYEILLLGLRIISHIPLLEQPLYMEMVYHPMLVIEQLLLAGRLSILGVVIKELTPHIECLPTNIQETECISKSRIDELLRLYANKALFSTPNSKVHFQPVEHMIDNNSLSSIDNFTPPDKPPQMKDWIPNSMVGSCMGCKEITFTMFNRRHHCRRCGRIICNSCSTHRCKVDGYEMMVRICDQCFAFESQLDSQSHVSSCSSITVEEKKDVKWKLSSNVDYNETVRQQFVYENSPSVSLCLSILELHSENITIPRFLFSRCEAFMRVLRAWESHENNDNYVQIYDIVRSLLLTTKVYFTHLGLPSGVEQCEELEDEIQLLDRLFKVNFTSLVPGRPIQGIVELRRVRDCLLSQQQWNLALEISTKVGLECSGIWFAWGKTCLKNGDWESAKAKFVRSSLDKNSSLLGDILQILCTVEAASVVDGTDQSGEIVNHKRIENECIYYLRTYGTNAQLITFYMERDQMKTALEFVLNENISTEVFLDKIYIPCLKSNSFIALHESMQEIDKSLIRWKEYLRTVCAYCDRNDYLKVLYTIQLWLKDYIRAAMTSIRFHLHGAHTYQELLLNIEHLHNACSHLEMSLNQTERNEIIMVLRKSEIEKHLNTACLQLDIIRVIAENPLSAHIQLDPLPTLFGSSSEKSDVIKLLFDATSNVKSAFTISHRLVTEYSLNSISVYGKVCRHLIRTNREEHIITLIQCIKERVSEPYEVIDKVITIALKEKPIHLEQLVCHISDDITKISMYIEYGLLKSAYLLAVKGNRLDFVEKILKKAENLKMISIQRICLQKLNEVK